MRIKKKKNKNKTQLLGWAKASLIGKAKVVCATKANEFIPCLPM